MNIAGNEEEDLCKTRIPDWDSIPETQRIAIKQLIVDTVISSYRICMAELGVILIESPTGNGDVN